MPLRRTIQGLSPDRRYGTQLAPDISGVPERLWEPAPSAGAISDTTLLHSSRELIEQYNRHVTILKQGQA